MMQKSITHKKEKLIRINPKLTQMLEVATKDMKRITIMHLISSKKESKDIKCIKKQQKPRLNLQIRKLQCMRQKNSQVEIQYGIP